ncbi:MAG: hypothetical protein K9G11_02705 [Rickettsiaceae bacterium]|nr:hypothetical protein [Rickettsiaceae bacterium]
MQEIYNIINKKTSQGKNRYEGQILAMSFDSIIDLVIANPDRFDDFNSFIKTDKTNARKIETAYIEWCEKDSSASGHSRHKSYDALVLIEGIKSSKISEYNQFKGIYERLVGQQAPQDNVLYNNNLASIKQKLKSLASEEKNSNKSERERLEEEELQKAIDLSLEEAKEKVLAERLQQELEEKDLQEAMRQSLELAQPQKEQSDKVFDLSKQEESDKLFALSLQQKFEEEDLQEAIRQSLELAQQQQNSSKQKSSQYYDGEYNLKSKADIIRHIETVLNTQVSKDTKTALLAALSADLCQRLLTADDITLKALKEFFLDFNSYNGGRSYQEIIRQSLDHSNFESSSEVKLNKERANELIDLIAREDLEIFKLLREGYKMIVDHVQLQDSEQVYSPEIKAKIKEMTKIKLSDEEPNGLQNAQQDTNYDSTIELSGDSLQNRLDEIKS